MKTRGLVIWPADAGAAAVARHFMERLAELGVAPDDVRQIAPGSQADVLAGLTRAVHHLVEVRRRQSIRLLILANAADPDARPLLALLDPVARSLQQLVAERPSVLMTLLLPSAFTGDEPRGRASAFLHDFESDIWDGAVVRICFLNATGTRTLEHELEDEVADQDLLQLLSRQLVDDTLSPFVESVGYARGNVQVRHHGRKCCFSTLGAVALVYPREACLGFLRARMARQIVENGFCSRAGLSSQDVAVLQARADAFVDRQVRDLGQRLPPSPAVGLQSLAGTAAADDVSEWAAKAQSEINRTIGGPLPHDLVESLAGACRREIEHTLSDGPGFLAGGLALASALEGRPLPGPREQQGRLSGAARFRELLCTAPLADVLEKLLDPLLDNLLAEAGAAVQPRREDETKLQWIRRSVEHAAATAGGSEKSARLRCVRAVLAHVLDGVLAGPGSAPKAAFLTPRVIEVFESEVDPLLQAIGERRRALETLLREEEDLRERYPWWHRLLGKKAATYRTERVRVRNATTGHRAELAALESSLQALSSLVPPILNQAAVPYDWKSKLADGFAVEVDAAVTQYRDFVKAVADAVPAVRPVPEVQTATRVTLHTPAKLDALFDEIRQGYSWEEHAGRTLAYLPASGGDVPYAGCRDLAGHYAQGPASLAARILDYADDRVSAVRARHALDILEMDGETAAGRFIEGKAREAGRFLAFDETSLAGFEQLGQWDVLYIVQAGGGKESRLADRYRGLFRPQVEFLDSGDPDTIDITCMRFGFPATLLRGFE